MAIAQEVHRERKARGWSQTRLAEECRNHGVKMTRSEIGNLEAGKTNLRKDKLEAIAKAFGLEWKL
jgi:transcriptional regulator with XRE-family HTH domain